MDDKQFDVVTVAYGVRNFERLAQGYAEMLRVLRPGGTLCVIELSVPRNPLIRWAYNIYSRHLIPAIGRLVSGDSRAYSYLPESIAACPQREEMTDLMRQAGFTDCRYRSLTFGTLTIYLATRP
jgi:demethylmenaquinone methyltransferase/2-methoxy-6-polyprenyl-1,4-benzoquinol methylase